MYNEAVLFSFSTLLISYFLGQNANIGAHKMCNDPEGVQEIRSNPLHAAPFFECRTKAHKDKSPLGQKPTGQKPTRTKAHWDKSPLGQKPTYMHLTGIGLN